MKENKKDSSKLILETAFRCLSTKGYANVSMRYIATEAGVALSQLNYYYKNKEGLFIEVINSMTQQYLYEIDERLKANKVNETRITSLIEYFKELNTKKPELVKLFIDFTAQALWVPSFTKLLKALYEKIIKLIEENMLIDNENINDKRNSSKALARLIFGAVFGISIQVLLGINDKDSYSSFNLVEELLFL